jgi:hypothetical protein
VGQLEAYGGLVAQTLHVLDPATGKDAVVGKVNAFSLGSHGLVYALDSSYSDNAPGKLVFVPTATLDALLG